MRTRLVSVVVLVSLVWVFVLQGCVTHMQAQSHLLPAKSRVGILLMSGNSPDFTYDQPYLYKSFWDSGLVPVALNEIDLSDQLGIPKGASALRSLLSSGKTAETVHSHPTFLASLQGYLKAHDIQYLVIMDVHTYTATDYDLSAVVISVEDMEVIGFRYSRDKLQQSLCWGLASVLGVPLLVCPWLYIHDNEAREIELISGMLQAFMGRRAGSN